ncbi:MAG: thiol peroxidase [Muribaculaceae bacterium]|nr:thiol peroxidase [Bacteroides sp.]MDE6256523.1 thiol peroxidase [Muribaculaceae bacterium]
MQKVNFNGMTFEVAGKLPEAGEKAKDFTLVAQDLSEIKLEDFKGKRVVLNIFPSLDTDVCAASVRRFNTEVAELPNTVVLCVSKDLPFAAARFCTVNGIKNVMTGSGFRSDFGDEYGVTLKTGPLADLYARALVIIDEEGKVIGSELVEEITNEPDYELAKKLLK